MLSSTETAPAGPQSSPVRRWLREPLLHFLLIRLVLFVLFRILNPAAVEHENRSRIELTDDDIRQLELGWMAQWAKFSRALFQLHPGSWQGPIESGFGWHLVWVDSMTPAYAPTFV